MDNTESVAKTLRALKWYAAVTTLIALAALILAIRTTRKTTTFDAITAHRINLVDNDGTLRLVFANRQNFPPPVIRGKQLDPKQRIGGNQAVLMFYNRDGTEQGTLRWDGEHDTTGGHQLAALTLDQLEQNDNLILAYGERGGVHHAGLYGREQQENAPLNVVAAEMDSAIARGHTKAERDSISGRFVAQHFAGRDRFSIGYDSAAASVRLSDPQGHLRLLMMVDSLGNPKIQFLDSLGHVTQEIPKR